MVFALIGIWLLAEEVSGANPVVLAVISGVVAVAVAALGIVSAHIAKASSKEAKVSADTAADYSVALAAKSASVDALEERVVILTEAKDDCERRCSKLEQRVLSLQSELDDLRESARSWSIMQRNYEDRIAAMEAKLL